VIVADTHVLVWLAEGSTRLGRRAGRLLEAAGERGVLFASAISFWEIALLAARGRLKLEVAATTFRQRALAAGIQEAPVTGPVALAAAELEGALREPADCLIAATALTLGAALCTADRRLLDWQGPVRKIDAGL
jgi:PIN domain nuclease of toxin-antitoxin system